MFLSIDWSGAFFSLMSIVAQTVLDPIGCALYLAVLILEVGIFASHWIWLFQTRKKRRLEKEQLEKTDLEAASGPSTDENKLPSGSGSMLDLSSVDGGWHGEKQ